MYPEKRKVNGEQMLVFGKDIYVTGFYNLLANSKLVCQYAFNYDKQESALSYHAIEGTEFETHMKDVQEIESESVKKGA